MKSKFASNILRAFTVACVSIASLHPSHAGQKVAVGANVAAANRVSIDAIDHAPLDALLRRYVDGDGNVDYTGWKASPEDARALEDYLKHLSTADPNAGASREAKLAYWINAYNAVTLVGILQKYPTTSIRNHTAKVLGYNIWHDLLLTVGGQPYSLDQMEHKVLRTMGEPRIHFAIVCASRSCPRLLAAAYTAKDLENQLTTNTKAFFAHPRNFQFDQERRAFRVSAILDWFGSDFGGNQTAVLRAIAPYLPTRQAYDAAGTGGISVSYLKYDWGLNDQATVR